ncbi:MAG: LytTR family DNA-binding domain-containing protein [Aureisphaera sp.]
MIRAIIVDDEPQMLKEVKERIQLFYPTEIAIMSEASNVNDALIAIETYKPELIFLDVQLNNQTGFDLIEKSPYKNYKVIFITAYDTNAIRAIKVGALDFILKPIDDDEFKAAVDKAISTTHKDAYLQKLIEVSQSRYKGIGTNRIILKTTEAVFAVSEEEIFYCKSEGNYTTVFTKEHGAILILGHLKKMLELLPQNIFIRCHQSYIVNKLKVVKYDKKGNLVLKNLQKIPVSSRRKESTLRQIF